MDEEKSWFQKNWKWVLSGGCLLPLLCLLLSGVLVASIFATIKNTDVYTQALTAAQTNPKAINSLGEPISDGWIINGNVETNTRNGVQTGKADLTIPVSGPNGSGSIVVDATLRDGAWQYDQLELFIEGEEGSINLKER